MPRATAHLYDERFVGYGKDRVSWNYELAAKGAAFVVLPDVFLIHFNTYDEPKKKSKCATSTFPAPPPPPRHPAFATTSRRPPLPVPSPPHPSPSPPRPLPPRPLAARWSARIHAPPLAPARQVRPLPHRLDAG